MRIALITLLTFPIFISGLLFRELTVLDASFGLAAYVVDQFGAWQHGALGSLTQGLLSFFCLVIFPFMVSAFFSAIAVIGTDELRKRSVVSSVLFAVVMGILLWGFPSSPDSRLSYYAYSASNF